MFEARKVETRGNVFVGGARRSWQDIDRELRDIAKRQRALDAEEAILLCTVVRREIWRELGRASLGTASQDVPPKVRRFVLLRDRKRCVVPGCRASRHIDVHHIKPQHRGGSHESENLTCLCAGHHRALHDGLLTITGDAPNLVVTWKYPQTAAHLPRERPLPHVGQPAFGGPPVSSSYGVVVKKTEAALALTQLGFTKQEARAVVEEAVQSLSADASLEQIVRAALRLTKR